MAAWAHDVARAMSEDELLRRAGLYGIAILPEERSAPILLHGPVGAAMLRRDLGWDDEELLEAVRYHTTGRAAMTDLQLTVLLADKVEPAKVHDEQMRRVRGLAGESLPAAARLFYRWYLANNERLGRADHPRAVEAAQWLAERE